MRAIFWAALILAAYLAALGATYFFEPKLAYVGLGAFYVGIPAGLALAKRHRRA